jgi:hypothetical protein
MRVFRYSAVALVAFLGAVDVVLEAADEPALLDVDEEVAAAGAAGAAGAAASLAPPDSLGALSFGADPPSFFFEAYKSEYQPPPLRTKDVRLTTRESVPSAPQCSHLAGVGSVIF